MSFTKPEFEQQYENYIGGEWVAPVDGEYFENTSPVDGSFFGNIPRSNQKDIDLAVKAAWKAAASWGKSSATERCKQPPPMFKTREFQTATCYLHDDQPKVDPAKLSEYLPV